MTRSQTLFIAFISLAFWAVIVMAWACLPRLAGVGCGPEKLIHWADEEDHFPTCDYIFPINPWK